MFKIIRFKLACDGSHRSVIPTGTSSSPCVSPIPARHPLMPASEREPSRASFHQTSTKNSWELSALIASPNIKTARQAMEFMGAVARPPVEVAAAVRGQARFIVSVAETIDPRARFSAYILYERVLDLALGVMAAARGLCRAGVDMRPELRALADACGKRENTATRQIQTGCEQIIKYCYDVEKMSQPRRGNS